MQLCRGSAMQVAMTMSEARCRCDGENAKPMRKSSVYHWMRHLDVGGSDLLLGERFSISARQSSNTLADGTRPGSDHLLPR